MGRFFARSSYDYLTTLPFLFLASMGVQAMTKVRATLQASAEQWTATKWGQCTLGHCHSKPALYPVDPVSS